MEMEEPIVLGGQIELAGFSALDGGQMIVVKKLVDRRHVLGDESEVVYAVRFPVEGHRLELHHRIQSERKIADIFLVAAKRCTRPPRRTTRAIPTEPGVAAGGIRNILYEVPASVEGYREVIT